MSWAEVVDAAVMGTGRGVVLSAAELAAAGLDHDDDQARLLNYAAAMSRARRAGFRPAETGARPAPDPADEDGRPTGVPGRRAAARVAASVR